MLVCMHEENIFKNICCCSPFGCLYLLSDLYTDLMVAGPRWRFETFSFLLYSQRFIKGQVEVARQKATCSWFYSEKYSRFSELLSGLKIAVL